MRQLTLAKIIARDRGIPDRELYTSYVLPTPTILVDTAKEFLEQVPPSFGACAMISASWAAFLRDKHNIPAIAVAGNLKIRGTNVFKCKKNLPQPGRTGKLVVGIWEGHCWLEVGGYICDLSIFRTAYATHGPSVLKTFVLEKFGYGKGALLSPEKDLNNMGMKFEPKYVLNEDQISSLIGGLGKQITDSNKI